MLIWEGSVIALTMLLGGLGSGYHHRFFGGDRLHLQYRTGLNQVGPATTYAALSVFQTWVCTVAMLIGAWSCLRSSSWSRRHSGGIAGALFGAGHMISTSMRGRPASPRPWRRRQIGRIGPRRPGAFISSRLDIGDPHVGEKNLRLAGSRGGEMESIFLQHLLGLALAPG